MTHHGGGLDTFNSYFNYTTDSVGYPTDLLVLSPLLVEHNVHSNISKHHGIESPTTPVNISHILDNIKYCDSSSALDMKQRSDEFGSNSCGMLFELLLQQRREVSSTQCYVYDACRDLASCPGALNSKPTHLFCSINPEVLRLLSVKVNYFLTVLPLHRPELSPCSYPPLSIDEIETKRNLEAFLDSYREELEHMKYLVKASTKELQGLINKFHYCDDGVNIDVNDFSINTEVLPGGAGTSRGNIIVSRSNSFNSGIFCDVKSEEVVDLEFYWK